jgi:hypothetical protein
LCQEAFPNDTVPKKIKIYCIITKFEETGSVCDPTHNRRHTVLIDDTPEDARIRLFKSHSKSLRKLCQQKNMSLSSAYQQYICFICERIASMRCTSWFQRACGPLGLLTYLHQISFCGVMSKDMSTTIILTPWRTWKRTSQEVIASMNHRTLRRVVQNMVKRVNVWVQDFQRLLWTVFQVLFTVFNIVCFIIILRSETSVAF